MMRRKEKEIRSREEMEAVIRKAKVCRLGFCDGETPYILPVCFGYAGNRIYVHSAPEGRKLDIIERNPRVCFEVEADVALREAPRACDWTITYKSVIGAGTASLVGEKEEKMEALEILMAHYNRKDCSFENADLRGLTIIRIDIHWMTGKES
jgi:nitroimidazol reductase NimA-like FMN-containing flavoprotein (pyridoxamine 5'-phosphate oxidase superfamily)